MEVQNMGTTPIYPYIFNTGRFSEKRQRDNECGLQRLCGLQKFKYYLKAAIFQTGFPVFRIAAVFHGRFSSAA